MKIAKIKSLGFQQTYNLEMKSKHHNYVATRQNGQPIHANSHAYAYGVVAYRSLWLKAHYPTEFWASILTFCHPDKATKYIGVAKSEGVNFQSLRTGFLHGKLTVDSDLNVYPSLTMVKGIGQSVADILDDTGGECSSLDNFVERYGKKKGPIERLIKLGAFDDLHPGIRKALWFWYQYKYCSKNEENTKIRTIYDSAWMEKNWPEEKLEAERKRQEEEYFKINPKKKKAPVKVTKWVPKIGYKHDNPSFKQFIEFWIDLWSQHVDVKKVERYYYRDWTDRDLLGFEKEYFGVYWSSPMKLFNYNPEYSFQNVREDDYKCAFVDGIIEKVVKNTTKNGYKYRDITINDGVETCPVRVWESSVATMDQGVMREGVGVRASIEWNDKYQNFNLARSATFSALPKRGETL